MTDLGTRVTQVLKTAEANLCNGTILEPRFLYDEIVVPGTAGLYGYSAPDVFKNGESFPIVIEKMMAAVSLIDDQGEGVADERLIQRIGMKLTFHGHDYQDFNFSRLPLWHNQAAAMSSSVSYGLSSHKFLRPWILSARDTMKVAVKLLAAPAEGTRTICVSFTGYGIQSKRPYYKSGDIELSDTIRHIIQPEFFRSDGDEPIVMTDMSVYCSSDSLDNNPQGDVRFCSVQVQQVGNGTQAEWVGGPTPGDPLMPGALWGTWAGRAIVHTFPAPLIWEPGEGLQATVAALGPLLETGSLRLSLGFAGTVIVL